MKRLAFILLCALPLLAQTRYLGRPLTDALRGLESHGLRLIYSDDVVTKEMRVKAEPRSRGARRILDELLHQHDLIARKGPRGSLVIVRKEVVVPRHEPSTTPQMPVALEEIVVTPSQFTILSEGPAARQFLSRDEVQRLPHFSDDLYRAIGRLPGMAAPDVSARFNLRGGDQDEVLVL